MSVASAQSDRFVILYGVPWETYLGIIDALGENHLRHTYDEGTVEMRAVVFGVSWEQYKQFLEALGNYNLRHSYDGWTLEMMSPLTGRDWDRSFVSRIVKTVAFTIDIDIQCIGSTTLTSDAIEIGLQPDESYYVANELRVRGKRTYEPDVDPPPDLILEVDVAGTSVPRMPLFAQLGIPEVWRNDDERTTFFQLQNDGAYQEVDHSVAFQFIRAVDIDECLDKRCNMTDNAVLRWFLGVLQERTDSNTTSR